MYDESNVFARILRGEIPAKPLYEDEHCLAFHDIDPKAPFHALVIPRASISRLAEATASQVDVLGRLLLAAAEVARREGHEDAYRVVINSGAGAGQTVFHLHLHVLAGRGFGWPPG